MLQRRSCHFAVQLAKWKGARFRTLPQEQECCASSGRQPIDYTKQKFEDVAAMSILCSTHRGETQERSWSVLKKGGCCFRWCNSSVEKAKALVSAPHLWLSTRTVLNWRDREAIDSGELKLRSMHSSLCEVRRAHELVNPATLTAKIVLRIRMGRTWKGTHDGAQHLVNS